MIRTVLILVFCISCSLAWDGTATHWCDSISFIKNTCGYPADGYYGALSDAQFPDIVKCTCNGARSTRHHPTLGNLPKCSKAPDCQRNFCGRKLCVECTDSRCFRRGQRVTISLSDACPADHPQNVDQCVNNAPDLGWCKCTQRANKHIDLGCQVFKALAPEGASPLSVRVTDGACGGSPPPPPPPPRAPPSGGSGGCSDVPPDSRYSCAQQASWGKCGQDFMKNFCHKTCGRCRQPPPPASSCSDSPPDSRFTCAQQASWGKCGQDFMRNFCHRSCGRCNRAVADNSNVLSDSNINNNNNQQSLSTASIVIIVVGVVIGVGMIAFVVLVSRQKQVEKP